MTNDPRIELREVEKIIPYAANPRVISPEAVAGVAGSIKMFGFNSPILVDKEGVIINGHTRFKAALSLGLKRVPIICADHLTDQEARAYRLVDNRVSEFSDWDKDLLQIEIDACDDLDLSYAALGDIVLEDEQLQPIESVKGWPEPRQDNYFIMVECRDVEHQKKLMEALEKNGEHCKAVIK